MNFKLCRICNNPIDIYKHNGVYCNNPQCYKTGKAISDRTKKQKRQFIAMVEGKKCTRCKEMVHKFNMKKYCDDCSAIMKETGGYVKKKPKPFNTNCIKCKCSIVPKLHVKYCKKCKILAVEEHQKKSYIIAKKKVKEINKQPKKKIDSKWTQPRGSKRGEGIYS